MVVESFTNQTSQELSLGNKLVPGRRYVIAIVGSAVAFDMQYQTPAGWKKIKDYTSLQADDTDTVFIVDILLVYTALRIAFASSPGTYHVQLQEVRSEVH